MITWSFLYRLTHSGGRRRVPHIFTPPIIIYYQSRYRLNEGKSKGCSKDPRLSCVGTQYSIGTKLACISSNLLTVHPIFNSALLKSRTNMTDPSEPGYWIDRWDTKRTGWHTDCVNPWLADNLDVLTEGREGMTIFVPMCGKTLDMAWLVRQGHCVVGVEVATNAIEEYFLDIPHTKHDMPENKGTKFQSNDGKIVIYCCDIFDFNSVVGGKFGAIWDRAALVALPPTLREKYTRLMLSLLKPDGRYMIECVDYDPLEKEGPPFPVPEETLRQLLGSSSKLETLSRVDSPEDAERFKISWFKVGEYLITNLK